MQRSIQASSVALSAPAGAASVQLDALRGAAALCVLLSHWRDCLFVDYAACHWHNALASAAYLVTGLGHQWVIVFFTLSGYLVGGSVLRQLAADRWSWRGYALLRLTRLYTVLIPALVLGALIDLAGIHLFGAAGIYGGQTGTHEIAANIGSRLSFAIAAGNYAFLQDIYVPVLGSNGPLWSLSYEFWYYLAFPLLMLTLSAKRSLAARAASAALLAAILWIVGRDVAVLGSVWLMGAAIHWLPEKKRSHTRDRLCIPGSLLAMAATLAGCKALHYRVPGFRHFVPSDLALGIVVTFAVYSLATSADSRLPVWYTRVARQTAGSSYTLYLVHVPAVVFLTAWLRQPRWQPDAEHLGIALAVLAAVYLYAQCVYVCFERNTNAVRVWMKNRWLRSPASARSSAKEPSGMPAALS